MYTVKLTEQGLEDYDFWVKNDKRKAKKIKQLMESCQQDPFSGIGKPEPLKFQLSGYWSRRIDHHNRLVYYVENRHVIIIQCRKHYTP